LNFFNYSDSHITFVDSVKPDTYHPSLITDFFCPLSVVLKITNIPTLNLGQGIIHYYVIFSQLMTDLVCMVYDVSFVNVAVTSLNATVQDAVEQTIPHDFVTKSKFIQCFSGSLRYYIRKKDLLL
jgi:hypothetical protein